jgi:hypothetical protein
VHGLYVQYLLLSQLQSRTPEKLVDVESELLQMIDESRLSAKKKLRSFNMHMAENRRIRALQALAASVLASPRYFIERLRDELFPRRLIANGIAPRYFRRRSTALWPQDSQV